MSDSQHLDPSQSQNAGPELLDRDFERLVLLADGELGADPQERAKAEAILERSAQARAVFADLQGSKFAIGLWATGGEAPAADVDLSMLRGRVMSRLPAEVRAPAAPAVPASWLDGVLQGLRGFGLGKAGFALGAVAVAALLVVWRTDPAVPPQAAVEPPAVASHLPVGEEDQPAVIIEELEVESGSVAVTPGSGANQPTVIWHFQGQGEG
jgi:hypothetical protein